MQLRAGWLTSFLLLSSAWSAGADEPAPFAPHFEPAACGFIGVESAWAMQHRVECGWLHVLESRGKPDSRKLRLWTAIARADRPSGEPPLVYLHGGPGLGTVDYFFPYFPQSKTWSAIRASRDVVYFDQRGTGRSEPAFCPELKPALETLRKQALPAAEDLKQTRSLFSDCRPRMLAAGFVFGSYNTSATVEDSEDLRRALKIGKWSLYGVSYGTLVALDYLRRHPGSIHAAILDSVYPPNSVHGHEQVTATALGYAAVQRACDRQAECRALMPSIAGSLAAAAHHLNATPLTATDGGRITGERLRSALWNMLVSSVTVPWVPLAIERAAAGDADAIRGIVSIFGGFDGFGDYSPGQALAVNCHDLMVGRMAPSVRLANQRHSWLADPEAIAESDDVLCAAWQTEQAPMTFFAPVASDIPTLLYGGEFDPATPYEDAVLAARHLSNATLIEVPGTSHAAMGRDECTRGIALAFLGNPSLPPDRTCLARRDPVVFRTEGLTGFLQSMKPD